MRRRHTVCSKWINEGRRPSSKTWIFENCLRKSALIGMHACRPPLCDCEPLKSSTNDGSHQMIFIVVLTSPSHWLRLKSALASASVQARGEGSRFRPYFDILPYLTLEGQLLCSALLWRFPWPPWEDFQWPGEVKQESGKSTHTI